MIGVWVVILYCASCVAEPLLRQYKRLKGVAHYLIGLCLAALYLTTAYLCYLVEQVPLVMGWPWHYFCCRASSTHGFSVVLETKGSASHYFLNSHATSLMYWIKLRPSQMCRELPFAKCRFRAAWIKFLSEKLGWRLSCCKFSESGSRKVPSVPSYFLLPGIRKLSALLRKQQRVLANLVTSFSSFSLLTIFRHECTI